MSQATSSASSLPAEALGRATPEELALLEDATAGDPALGRELDAYRATVTALECGVAREAPSADLFDRILAEIRGAGGAARG